MAAIFNRASLVGITLTDSQGQPVTDITSGDAFGATLTLPGADYVTAGWSTGARDAVLNALDGLMVGARLRVKTAAGAVLWQSAPMVSGTLTLSSGTLSGSFASALATGTGTAAHWDIDDGQ